MFMLCFAFRIDVNKLPKMYLYLLISIKKIIVIIDLLCINGKNNPLEVETKKNKNNNNEINI